MLSAKTIVRTCRGPGVPTRALGIPAVQRLAQNAAGRRYYSTANSTDSTSGSQGQARKGGGHGKGRTLLALGALALGSTWLSLSYQKSAPQEFLEEPGQKQPTPAAGPAFSPKDVSVIFVLGGPGAGKGTQCGKLVADYNFVHLSAGDLLRAEQKREGSEYGQLIKKCITEGLIVPQEVTLALLRRAIQENVDKGNAKFLVDGFPRKMDQALSFEEQIVPSKFTLFFDCPEQVMLSRLLERGKTSGRDDDNIESIKKRFRTFVETSMPVVEYFDKKGKVVKLSCDDSVDVVYSQVQKAVKENLHSHM